MQTDKWFWVPWMVAILAGGAMGAVITALVSYRRNRRQPVGKKIEFFPVLHRTPNFPSLRAILMDDTDSDSGPGVAVENLYLARVTIVNEGNQDIPEFKFGATLTGDDEAINVLTETPDRHHSMVLEKTVSLAKPGKELDFRVTPFNRKEPCIANIYFRTKDIHGEIRLSTSHSSRFIERRDMPRIMEVITDHPMLINGFLVGAMMPVLFLAIVQNRENARLTERREKEVRELQLVLEAELKRFNSQGREKSATPTPTASPNTQPSK